MDTPQSPLQLPASDLLGSIYHKTMKLKYYRDAEGGFIGSEDGQTQVCDFREGMGDRFGEQFSESEDVLDWARKAYRDMMECEVHCHFPSLAECPLLVKPNDLAQTRRE